MINIMLDIETVGNASDAAMISLGAVAFTKDEILNKFYQVIDLESSLNSGGTVTASTLIWWMQQAAEVRAEFNKKGAPLSSVLDNFSTWIGMLQDDVLVWGNGASFDNTIVASAYKNTNLELPWKFYNNRCYRTIKAMHPDIPLERKGVAHNALDDAETQALHLIKILKEKYA